MSSTPDRLYFRQLQAGRDFATEDRFAIQMANFIYLIGDRESRECLIVDPAWDVDGVVATARADGLEPRGALVTHYHPDHVGGDLFGHSVQGLSRLLELGLEARFHVHEAEAEGVRRMTGLSESDLRLHAAGDTVRIGSVEIELVHTPGHTPGSQCFLVDGHLVAGDTLFVQGCGRVDLPGGDPEAMYYSLTRTLAALPDDTVLFPGHDYGGSPSSTMGEQRRSNHYLRIPSLADWLGLMGRTAL